MKKLLLLVSLFHSLISFSQSTLDVTFGNNGIVSTSMGAGSVIYGMVTQADKKVVVAGTVHDGGISAFALARYNINGTLDSAFDGDGKVTTVFGQQAEAFAVALQADGKIIAGGYMYNDSSWEFALVRYNVDGSPDTSFGTNGKVQTAIGIIDDEIKALSLQSDGKIIAVGYTNAAFDFNEYLPQIAVVRYNINGSLDSTFNNDGIIITSFGNYDLAYSAGVQPDGKIIVGGTHVNDSGKYQFLVVRYNHDGSHDNTFNNDGKIITTMGNYYDVIHSVVIQGNGKILVSGTSGAENNWEHYHFALARFNSNGKPDSTFDKDGKIITCLQTPFDIAPSVALQNDGKIIVAGGLSSNTTLQDLALIRYNNDGSLDSTFDGDGKLITTINGNEMAYAIKIVDSRIIIAGSNQQFMLIAYTTESYQALPVSILSFSAVNVNNLGKLQWLITGQGAKVYEVEKSRNGIQFLNIGNVVVAPDVQDQKAFSFNDPLPLENTVYYRLKIVDVSGSSKYSKIVILKGKSDFTLNLYPNPTTDFLKITSGLKIDEPVTMHILNASGMIVQKKLWRSTTTGLDESVDVRNLPGGIYFLAIHSKEGKEVKRFVKQ